MRLEAVKYEGGKLILTTNDREALKLVDEFAPGEYEIRKARQHRSPNANRYAWALIDKIAAALSLSKIEIYREAIRDIGGVSTLTVVRNDALDVLRAQWGRQGIGWQTEIVEDDGAYTTVSLIFGSSVYDTAQMSQLIDHLIQDAKALGIETLPPDKLEGMMLAWEEASAQRRSQ